MYVIQHASPNIPVFLTQSKCNLFCKGGHFLYHFIHAAPLYGVTDERLRRSPYFADSTCHFQDPITCDKLKHFACRHSLTFMQCRMFAFSISSPDWISPSMGPRLLRAQSVLNEAFSTESWHFNHPPPPCYPQVRNTVNRIKERRKAINFSVSSWMFACFLSYRRPLLFI